MQLLTLQLDSRGVTAIVAEPRSDGPMPIGTATVAQTEDAGQLAESLRNALPSLRSGKLEIAVALSPSDARVRRLSVPPVPAEELPPIVAMQAAREAGVDAEELTADFAPPASESNGPPELLVAWTSKDCLAFWEQVASKLGGRLAVVTSRALALSSLAGHADTERLTLVANRAGDQIDLAAVAASAPVIARSARLSDTGEAASAKREIRRTILSLPSGSDTVPQVLSDWPSEDTRLLGDTIPTSGLDASLAEGVRSAVSAWALAVSLTDASPTHLPQVVNLADPRQPPVKETGKRQQVLLAIAAASVVIAGAWMGYSRLTALDEEIAELQRQLDDSEAYAGDFQPQRDQVAAVDRWLETDVTWLDEIDRLGKKLRPARLDAEDFPVEGDVRVTQLLATATGDGTPGGRLQIKALARRPSTSEFEARLRDASHLLEPISTSETDSPDAYRYEYSAVLRTPPEPIDTDPDVPPASESEPVDDELGDDEPIDDKAGDDKAGGDEAGDDEAGDDKAGGDNAGGDVTDTGDATGEEQPTDDTSEQASAADASAADGTTAQTAAEVENDSTDEDSSVDDQPLDDDATDGTSTKEDAS